MRRLFRFIFQLISLVVVLIAMTAVWIIVDGLTDVTEKSDVALFAAGPEDAEVQLDRLAKLYKDGEIPAIILCEKEETGTHDRFESAGKYLAEHGVPADAIVEKTSYLDTWDMAQKVAHDMKTHEYGSVMLVTDYYRMTRLKIALGHEGVLDIRKNHLGSVRGQDVIPIAWEVAALYNYVGKTFLLPAAEKIKNEAKVGVDKAKEDAHEAKKKVDNGLDNLAK